MHTIQARHQDGPAVNAEEAWTALASGQVGLHEIPAWYAALYNLGYSDALAAAQPQIQAAEAAADRYYERWTNPGKRLAAAAQRRIDEAFIEAEERGTLRSVVDDVDTAVRAATAPHRPAA